MVTELTSVDHVVAGDENILSQYEDSPLFQGFVNSFLTELNDLETEYGLFKTDLPLANAVQANLDKWGDILQSPTRPVSDEDFRVLLYALIGAYYSEGRPQDIRALVINVMSADSIVFLDIGQAIFSFSVINPVFTFDPLLVVDLVNLAKPAGVEFLGFAASYTPYFGFTLDTSPDSSTFSVIGGDDGGFYTVLII